MKLMSRFAYVYRICVYMYVCTYSTFVVTTTTSTTTRAVSAANIATPSLFSATNTFPKRLFTTQITSTVTIVIHSLNIALHAPKTEVKAGKGIPLHAVIDSSSFTPTINFVPKERPCRKAFMCP